MAGSERGRKGMGGIVYRRRRECAPEPLLCFMWGELVKQGRQAEQV